MTIGERIREVHANAVEHGWWDEDRSYEEISALIHSEASEALEEYRAGRPNVWFGEGGKPEGIAIELIDIIIRVYDFIGMIEQQRGVNVVSEYDYSLSLNAPSVDEANEIDADTLPEFINFLHNGICDAFASDQSTDDMIEALLAVVVDIRHWIKSVHEDVETLLDVKHAYNVTRPYKHGKKC